MRYEYLLLLASAVLATPLKPRQEQAPENVQIPSPIAHTSDLTACQGYRLTGADDRDDGIDGTLELIGNCTAYGPDYPTLNLTVRYETADRLRVQIRDAEGKAHVVPDDVASWPKVGENNVGKEQSKLEIQWQSEPFSFKIVKKDTGEVIFDTTGQAIVFEEQYLRIQSALSAGSNIQGLGQHNDNFTLPIDRDNYVRTLWTRDAYGVPSYTNLYGAHPIFVNQKVGQNASASGVYLLNSNGMDVKFPNGTAIEYNVLGGIIDLFFLNGPTPADVARQGAQIWGTSSEVPYWSLGFHSCKYGYIDIAEVAEVVANYTTAGIPVQTQWMDIDYMYERWIQTLDPDRFAIDKVRYVIDQLQSRGQDFVVMVDPAVFSGTPNSSVESYETYQSGVQQDIFLKLPSGEIYEGVVWPGPTAFPDWTHPNAQSWWNSEFARFFDKDSGVDVSGIWLDMNEPANFLPYLEANIYRVSAERPVPPPRPLPRIIPNSIEGYERFTAGQNISAPFSNSTSARRAIGDRTVEAGFAAKRQSQDTVNDYIDPSLDSQWLYPPYRIDDRRQAPSSSDNSAAGSGQKNISDFSARTDIVQANGARTYDEHNLYGSRHAIRTRNSLLERRPGQKPFTIARSSFSGTPSSLWLGDNISNWDQYIQTIRQMLGFGAIYGVGVVGGDSCGFGGNTTETLCARWAWLGAFNTFYRNHNELGNIPQEFYRWNLTTIAARAAGKTRLRLLDYTYTFLHRQNVDGTPSLWPLSWVHPEETETIGIESQFYFGDALLVSPVTAENSTSVTIYVPNEVFYDFFTLDAVNGTGSEVTIDNVGYETMPLHIRGGSIVPLRTGDAMTTGENRDLPFHLVIAPNRTNEASGTLRLDDGISLEVGDAYSDVEMTFKDDQLEVKGTFGYESNNKLDMIVFAGQNAAKSIEIDGQRAENQVYDSERKTLTAWNLGTTLKQMTVRLV